MANKITKKAKKMQADAKTGRVENFMGNDSFRPDPVMALRMAAASSIFGEPQYYRDGMRKDSQMKYRVPAWLRPLLIVNGGTDNRNSAEYMEELIDKALDADFGAVLDFAAELRRDYYARLNPQIIMVRAAMHPKRAEYSEKNPGKFRDIEQAVMTRADEPAVQASYYLYANKGQKNKIPSILKRSWADRLGKATAYEINKYKNAEIGMIDTVRLCHAKGELINELMKNGGVVTSAGEKTWENLRSEGMSWKDIFATTKVPHMAVLRNLRGIANELEDTAENRAFMESILNKMESGVPYGKQYPFRYYTAYREIEKSDCHFKPVILASLSRCMKTSVKNLPPMKGKVMVLSDNSGSAWGTIPTEYGKVTVAEIGNLSAIITAMTADEGYVGIFGDDLEIVPINKEADIMDCMTKLNKIGRGIGGGTENGVWLFFKDAVENKQHWDTVFIYSDMQAGYSGLYGINRGEPVEFVKKHGFEKYLGDASMINVVQLVEIYRREVNAKCNVFCVQTAGYDNNVLPQLMHRVGILYGWTGKEAVYADKLIKEWDTLEAQRAAQ